MGHYNSYQETYDHFVELIDTGQLRPGDQLPTYPEIKDRFGISHATVSKVVRLLREGDYVHSSAQGVFVSRTKQDRLLQRLTDTLNALEEDGQSPQLETTRDGACVAVRTGAVCWNPRVEAWEKITY